MNQDCLRCYRCGESLEKLTPPLSRQDTCPACTAYLHVCRMCRHYDPAVPEQCTEDDAERVTEKERPNFCDWFVPSGDAFDPVRAAADNRARNELESLFGGSEPEPDSSDDSHTDAADDLFR